MAKKTKSVVKKEETSPEKKKDFKKKARSHVPVYWRVGEKIWVQVAVSDHANHDPLKRSRRTRKVVDIFCNGRWSDEEVYETTEDVLKDLKLHIRFDSDRAPKGSKKEKVEKTSRKRIDKKAIEAMALAQKKPFKASVIQKQSDASLAMVRQILGAMVKAGTLRSVPKKGYEPV